MELYLEYYAKRIEGMEVFIEAPIESYIVLALLKYLRVIIIGRDCQLNFVECKTKLENRKDSVWLELTGMRMKFFQADKWPETASYCQVPCILHSFWVLSGLCSICRHFTKCYTLREPNSKKLMGFKGNTLLAPAELSLWTKFCEIDIEACVREVLQLQSGKSVVVPECLGKLERHLAQPLKAHNVYKLVNNVQNVKVSSSQEHQKLSGETNHFDFKFNHRYVEGYEKTLADIMLFICIYLISKRLPMEMLLKHLPRVTCWHDRMISEDDLSLKTACDEILMIDTKLLKPLEVEQLIVEVPENFSLYKADTKKMNLMGAKVLTTNQPEVRTILGKVKNMGLDVQSIPNDRDGNLFDWSTVPLEAQPAGGNLPQNRIDRKKHQLESLANEVISIAKPGDRIVEFCSGTGHLGILLAVLLPECTLFLVENKQDSQELAMGRVHRLGLKNVTFVRSNLEYFNASFNIGVSLHACGVATDIVLDKCFAQRAKFVSCPCCYGKLYEFDRIRYPRSRVFQTSELSLKEYLCLAHCADQTHDVRSARTNIPKAHQGYYCMDIIDKDRMLHAEELGYTVVQKRLRPQNCTPKNRLLIGTL
ncbi:glutathione S-transferase C-terminal domain-containing protein homolog [Armigeres subalbatus]|uniref:glutathione S-transferase C-terminal domain-containing protein homolog n=1 Tax=Armigeres subalbatus TaxID=124917 RepID=UPI002ED6AC1E